ncbi:hypothetical protein [Stappia sp.]|uniref:hypothetical protein n=1 Tax=Stappia sp. TaxID=1870903 RepID=UPI0032D9AD76
MLLPGSPRRAGDAVRHAGQARCQHDEASGAVAGQETVAVYPGGADRCRIDIQTDSFHAFFVHHDACDPVTFGALDPRAKSGSSVRHQPDSPHCAFARRILRLEGIVD